MIRKQDKVTSTKNSVRPLWRPKSLQAVLPESSCPYCKGKILTGYSICPQCGHSLLSAECSFCGAPMKEKQRFCTRCGQNREGLLCPQCGVLNSRNFCRNCNIPLTPMAVKVLEDAFSDPAFVAIRKKALEMAELKARIEDFTSEEMAEAGSLSEEDLALLDKYAELLDSIGAYQHVQPKRTVTAPTSVKAETDRLSMDDLIAVYKDKANEMNAALEALTPPAGSTPQQQRDYFSARKVMKIECDMRWKCNLCGALHPNPAACAEPELGGTWIAIETNIKIE